MLYLVLGIVALGIFTGLMELISQHLNGKEEPIRVQKGNCNTCTGDDSACEQVCMMKAATKDIVYFDNMPDGIKDEYFALVSSTEEA